MRKINNKILRRLLILTPAVSAVLLGTAAAQNEVVNKSHDAAYARNMSVFSAITKELEENYVDSIRTDEAFKAAIRGMLATVDPYTEFYSYDERDNLIKMTTGSYAGIGAYVIGRDSATFISEPIMNSPAMKAGLRAGDKILSVDSVSAIGIPTDKTTSMLKGTPGTTVKVTVLRSELRENETDSILTYEIIREKVSEPSVPWWGVVDEHTGYIRLTQFIDSSPADVKEALEAFKGNPEVKNIVLDLRSNGGGLVDSAIEILGFFLPKGTEVLSTKSKLVTEERTYKTRTTPIMPDIPLAVLIDGGSASASEIVAGAIQDLDRGILVGSRSFGKGLVQGTRPLPYSNMLKVTVAKYYTPSGRLIQALDYSRRNEDGSVARTPDSLTNVYKTLNGREVRDGGGLIPDSTVNWGQSTAVLYGLVAGHHIFDFATRYAARHKEIAPAGQFSITDEDFNEFVESVNPTDFKYDKICNDILKNLKEAATQEGYMNPEVEATVNRLDSLLDRDLKSDLYAKRDEITEYINEEIISRYSYQGGRTRQTLMRDKALRKAEEIFNTPGLYEKILRKSTRKK